ncbi:MAG TPA: pentapeptide repeat-containing protein [Solirubrobacterales bacterium]|nr:pentapeptide repeat-containing protein [Solirubrobacterales bacterium]
MTEPPDVSFADLRDLDPGGLEPPVEVEDARIEAAAIGAVEWGSASFEHAHLIEVDFEGAKLRGLSLVDLVGERVNAANGRWLGATLRRVAFRQCRLTGLDLGEARLADVSFEDCKLDYANFRHGEIDHVTFSGCAMTEADFQGAKIGATRFDGCDLGRADFTKAELDEVDARGSTLNLAGSVLGLRGLKIDALQLMDLSRAMAAEIGIEVEDRG